MKVLIGLLLIHLFCPSYYTADSFAVPDAEGTSFVIDYQGELHEFGTFERYSGAVTLVMDKSGTDDDCTDDLIVAVIPR